MINRLTIATLASSIALASSASIVDVSITKPGIVGDVLKNLTAQEAVRRASFGTALNTNSANGKGSAPAVNLDVTYTTSTIVDQQTFNLIVDTGSSNTWVGAGKKYVPKNSTDTLLPTQVTYGSGEFSGTEYQTSVTLGGLTAYNQYIGVASASQGFGGVDGIIGFGPVDLTAGTVATMNTVPTFLDTLYAQKTIQTEVLGVSFAPIQGSATSVQNGVLTLGGVNSQYYRGSITYTPRTRTAPYSYYWGIDVSAITYKNQNIGSASAAIVDTGTTLIYIPQAAYNAFLQATGGTTDSNSGFASFTTQPTGTFAFTIARTQFTLTPQQYLIPKAQYANFGLSAGKYYSWIGNGGDLSSSVNFIIGQKFLENYYAVFDTTHNQVGFAPRR